MAKAMRFLLQAVNYTIFMFIVWYFSAAPPFRQLDPDQAVVTLAFSHAGERREECRTLTPQELAKLPPNMRRPADCPRERSPIHVDLLLNDETLIEEIAHPPGLYSDQGVDIYRSVKVPAGEHLLSVRMNDNVRVEGPTRTLDRKVNLTPGQLLVVDYNSENLEFVVK